MTVWPFNCFLCLSSLFCIVSGYSSGAPKMISENSCKMMYPKHKVEPQTSVSPYTIYLSRSEVKPSGMVEILITSSMVNTKIKGFFLQGRKVDFEKNTKPMGTFLMAANYNGSQVAQCGQDYGNIMTHTDNMEKSDVRAVWMASKEPGTYVILCTVVRHMDEFWVRQPSSKIVVGP